VKRGDRILVVNADDFGLTAGVNRGIARAHEHGIVTSVSLMVRQRAAVEASEYARARPELGVGLHVDLGEWRYVRGSWAAHYEVVSFEDPEAVAAEVASQLGRFRELLGRDPTHLDSHQHVHRDPGVGAVLRETAARLGVPLRGEPGVRHVGDFYGQTTEGETVPAWTGGAVRVGLLETLTPGVTELSCHPGEPDGLDSPYALDRAREVETLCDGRVREAVARLQIRLRTFGVQG